MPPWTRRTHRATVKKLEQSVVSESELQSLYELLLSAGNTNEKLYLAKTVILKLNDRRDKKMMEAWDKRKEAEEAERAEEAKKMAQFYSHLEHEIEIPKDTLNYISADWNQQYPDGKDHMLGTTPDENRFKKHHIHLIYEILLDSRGEWNPSEKVRDDQKIDALDRHNKLWPSEKFDKNNLTSYENDPGEGLRLPTLDEEIKKIRKLEDDDSYTSHLTDGGSYNISKKITRIRSKFRKRKSKSRISRKPKKHQKSRKHRKMRKSRKPKKHRKSKKSRKNRY